MSSGKGIVVGIVGGSIALIALEHTLKKWNVSWRPSLLFSVSADAVAVGSKKCGEVIAKVSNLVSLLGVEDIGTTAKEVAVPFQNLVLSPLAGISGYVRTARSQYQYPVLTIAGTGVIFGGMWFYVMPHYFPSYHCIIKCAIQQNVTPRVLVASALITGIATFYYYNNVTLVNERKIAEDRRIKALTSTKEVEVKGTLIENAIGDTSSTLVESLIKNKSS
jgi:hypothetical protein